MSHNLDASQLAELRSSMRDRSAQLREEIRQVLLRSDSEQYVQIANEVHDLEDESFADLMVDVNLAEIDRDLQELRAIEAAVTAHRRRQLRALRALRLADRVPSPSAHAVREPLLRLPVDVRTHALPEHRPHPLTHQRAAGGSNHLSRGTTFGPSGSAS